MSAMMPSGKLCVLCKTDCDGKPRVKDAHGRYFHRDCYERVKKAAGAKAAAPKPKREPVIEAVPADLDDEFAFAAPSAPPVRAVREVCPMCAAPMPSDAILCTACGFNRVSGRQMAPMAAPVVERSIASRRPSFNVGLPPILTQPWVFGLGALAFFVVFALIAKNSEAAQFGYFAVQGIYGLIVGIVVLVVAFKDSVMDGVLCLITCGIYALYYVLAKQENAHLKWAYGVSMISTALGYALGFNSILKQAGV